MNTGGPAFPGTLLDWFAGQALEGLLSNQYRKGDVQQYTADAYTWASAMLAEKARRGAVVKESSTADHSGEANKMVEFEARNRELVAQNIELTERIKRLEEALSDLVSLVKNNNAIRFTSEFVFAESALAKAKEAKP